MSVPTLSLGAVADILAGNAWSASRFNQEGNGLPVVRIQNVGSSAGELVYWDDEYSPRFIVRNGDLLLSLSGSFRLARWHGTDALLNQRVVKLTLSGDVDEGFFFHFMQTQLAKIERMGRHALVNNVSISDLKTLGIPLPPLSEQRRIAAILDKADALRAKRREAIAKLDQLLQSVFLDTFGDPVSNSRAWPVQLLGNLCDVRDGTHDSPKYVEIGHPLVTSKNLASGRVNVDGAQLISKEDFASINKRSKVDQGDLLMPMIGTVGNPVLVDHEPSYAIKNIALIKFGRTSISNVYVLHLLKSRFFDVVTSRQNRGGSQKFLALRDIRGMQIPVPNARSQHYFNRFVEMIEQQKQVLQSSADQLESGFASIQQRAFSGTL